MTRQRSPAKRPPFSRACSVRLLNRNAGFNVDDNEEKRMHKIEKPARPVQDTAIKELIDRRTRPEQTPVKKNDSCRSIFMAHALA